MYSLLSGLWNACFRKVQYQALILGLDGAGKTTLLEQLRCQFAGAPKPDSRAVPPTVGLNVGKIEVGNTNLLLWDLGGQSGLRVIWDKYFADAHAIIYVIDAADMKRFDESAKELEAVLAHPDTTHAPLLVLANKCDVHDAVGSDDIAKRLELTTGGGANRKIHVQSTSALKGKGVEDGLRWLLGTLPNSARERSLTLRSL